MSAPDSPHSTGTGPGHAPAGRTRREVLLGTAGLVGALALGVPGAERAAAAEPTTKARPKAARDCTGLWEHAARRGIIYGTAGERAFGLEADPVLADRFGLEAAMLTPEGGMKWGSLRPSIDTYDFTEADWILDFAERHDMLFHGHTLVWYQSFRKGVQQAIRDSGRAEQIMVDHIETVAGRYAGRVHSWDVVNEAIAPVQGHPDGLRTNSVWFQTIGASYLDTAYHAARAADPTALLVYNDYAYEYGGAGLPAAAYQTATLRLLEGMVARGVPVDAFGVQAHLGWVDAFNAEFDQTRYARFLSDVADLGLKIMITELDAADTRIVGDVATRDAAVADGYRRYLDVVLDERAVISVQTWGLSDRWSWLRGFSYNQRPDAQPIRPLPLDDELNRKPVWSAMAAAFDRAPRRRLVTPVPFPRHRRNRPCRPTR